MTNCNQLRSSPNSKGKIVSRRWRPTIETMRDLFTQFCDDTQELHIQEPFPTTSDNLNESTKVGYTHIYPLMDIVRSINY
jgi:hypothetical protein